MDYQTTQRDQNASKLNRSLLQTHEYNQRIQNPEIAVSLLKKEVDLFYGVIPLVQYESTTYLIENRRFPRLPDHYHILQVDSANMDILIDFLEELKGGPAALFQLSVFAETGTLISLLKAQVLYMSCLCKGGEIYAFYFWKDTKTQYVLENDVPGDIIQSIATVNKMSKKVDPYGRFFYLGFLHALHGIVKGKPSFKILLLEEIADTVYLHPHWRRKHTAMYSHFTAYYSFNLICPRSPISANQCLFLL
jgi:hypothetical protein